MKRRTRREFCQLTAAGFVVGIGCAVKDGHGTDDGAGASSEPGSSTDASTTTGVDETSGSTSTSSEADTGEVDSGSTGSFECEPSAPSIEGPFYRPDIPIRTDLNIHGDPGVSLHMSGRVLDTSCNPVANAVVELWHATPLVPGAKPGDALATYDDTGEYRYYGQTASDERGNYRFDTLQPGWYLNGAEYRPAHLHIKIWMGEAERLTTQVYFSGDPFNADDPWFDPAMVLMPDADGNAVQDFTI